MRFLQFILTWTDGAHGLSNGAQFGVWVAIFAGLGEGLIDHAVANITDLTGTIIGFVIAIAILCGNGRIGKPGLWKTFICWGKLE